jgi:hypothetical protein
MDKIPKIVVWDLNSGNTLKIITGFHRGYAPHPLPTNPSH